MWQLCNKLATLTRENSVTVGGNNRVLYCVVSLLKKSITLMYRFVEKCTFLLLKLVNLWSIFAQYLQKQERAVTMATGRC